jgi:dTDP-4-dehydrorhamnose reductase
MLDDHADTRGRELIVGDGLIGGAVRSRLLARGDRPISLTRESRAAPDFAASDLTGPPGRSALHDLLGTVRPSCVLLVHGPSDVTWIEEHEQQAAAVHCEVAQIVADSGLPAVLVSTDNVFPGTRGGYQPSDHVQPSNAYGRVKARAEDLLLAGGSALVLRVSLVYGWTGTRHRSTFAERCLRAAFEGEPLPAPTDQILTPIHVRDVVDVTAALLALPRPITGTRHLSGPEQLSRYEFATTAYRIASADVDLVQPCLRRDTQWASRPQFSSLACGDFSDLPGLRGWRPLSPESGLRAMLAERLVDTALSSVDAATDAG